MVEINPLGKEGNNHSAQIQQNPLNKATKNEQVTSEVTKQTHEDISKILNNDLELEKIYHKVSNNFNNAPSSTKNWTRSVIDSLMKLSHAMNKATVARATRLDILSDLLTSYATQQKQIPLIKKEMKLFPTSNKQEEAEERDKRATLNDQSNRILDSIRINKGIIEDRSKRVQVLLQTSKDNATSTSDALGNFIDNIRNLRAKFLS